MSGGSLLQLVSLGARDISTMRHRNISHDYNTYVSETNCNPMRLSRDADVIVPEFLELTFNNPEINNLDDVKKLILVMSIGGSIIQQFPLNLLMGLNEPIICDGKMYINLCFNMLFGDIKAIGLSYHDVIFQFANNDAINCILRYGIVAKLSFIDTDERRQVARNTHEEFIQQISVFEHADGLNDTSNRYNLTLPFIHFSKGFFIDCTNVDNLNNIKLTFNSQERFNLNRFLIRTKCKKINQNILYLPFNYDKDYSDRSSSSYEGTPDLSRIDNVRLILSFDNPVGNIKIYNLYSNVYRQMGGMGGLAFVSDFGRLNIDVSNHNYNREGISREGTTIEYTGPTYKQIMDMDASSCPILYEVIKVGGRYMTCNQCNNHFSEEAIKQWLEPRRIFQRTCPLCREEWTNYEIYINAQPEISETDPLL